MTLSVVCKFCVLSNITISYTAAHSPLYIFMEYQCCPTLYSVCKTIHNRYWTGQGGGKLPSWVDSFVASGCSLLVFLSAMNNHLHSLTTDYLWQPWSWHRDARATPTGPAGVGPMLSLLVDIYICTWCVCMQMPEVHYRAANNGIVSTFLCDTVLIRLYSYV